MDEIDENQKSQYGSDFHYLRRIQIILDKSVTARLNNDAYLWFRLLTALRCLLSIKMTEAQKADFKSRIIKITDFIAVYAKAQDYNPKIIQPKLTTEFYMILDKFEEDLLNIADKHGLLLKTMSEGQLDDY